MTAKANKLYLSKSKLISAWQCPKKLHLEIHHPELGEVSANTEYPVMGLRGSTAKLGAWVEAGYRDIRDIGVEHITSESQLRIHRVTCSGELEVLDGARREIVLYFSEYRQLTGKK